MSTALSGLFYQHNNWFDKGAEMPAERYLAKHISVILLFIYQKNSSKQ